jgi:hypothetical protein
LVGPASDPVGTQPDPVRPQSDPIWRKAARCDTGACVEVAAVGSEVWVRDSTDPDGSVLRFPRGAWVDFLDTVRAGELG